MSEQDFPRRPRSEEGVKPGGVSLQTIVAIVLALAVVAALYLFFGPSSQDQAVLPTTTPGPIQGLPTFTPPVTATLASEPLSGSGVLQQGSFVEVSGTDEFGLSYRLGPGSDYLRLRIVPEGEVMKVVGGPEQAESHTWWRLQDQYGNIGWASETWLALKQSQPSWNPPLASPTFSLTETVDEEPTGFLVPEPTHTLTP
jgi:hypothetical protein